MPVPYSQRGPAYATATVTLRRLEVGEHRCEGDLWLSYGQSLEPVTRDMVAGWWPWRNRIGGLKCPHYRVVRTGDITPLHSS